MTNRSKLLSESDYNKTLEDEQYTTSSNKYQKERKLWKYYEKLWKALYYAYMQHLDFICGILQLIT